MTGRELPAEVHVLCSVVHVLCTRGGAGACDGDTGSSVMLSKRGLPQGRLRASRRPPSYTNAHTHTPIAKVSAHVTLGAREQAAARMHDTKAQT